MGNTKASAKFLDYTKYPAESLILDQGEALYSALEVKKGFMRTLVYPVEQFKALVKRVRSGRWRDMWRAFRAWHLTVPEKDKSWIQGGAFVFQGRKAVWSHLDKTPGDYPSFDEVLKVVKQTVQPQ